MSYDSAKPPFPKLLQLNTAELPAPESSSSLLDRVRDFLPKISTANAELEAKLRSKASDADQPKSEESIAWIEDLGAVDSDDDTSSAASSTSDSDSEEEDTETQLIKGDAPILAAKKVDLDLVDQKANNPTSDKTVIQFDIQVFEDHEEENITGKVVPK